MGRDIEPITYRPISKQEEIELTRKYREEGDIEAKQALVLSCTALALQLAARYAGRDPINAEEYNSESLLGLVEATKNYDGSHRFGTYAAFCCRRRLLMYWWRKRYLISVKADATDKFKEDRIRAGAVKVYNDVVTDGRTSEREYLDDQEERRLLIREIFELLARIPRVSLQAVDVFIRHAVHKETLRDIAKDYNRSGSRISAIYQETLRLLCNRINKDKPLREKLFSHCGSDALVYKPIARQRKKTPRTHNPPKVSRSQERILELAAEGSLLAVA
jgi:RNA polymerase sigma factor (sigma-70 family)